MCGGPSLCCKSSRNWDARLTQEYRPIYHSHTMILLNNATESKKFDTRVIERNLQRGRITPEEIQKSVDSLPDDAENADYIEIESLVDEDLG
jgi:hypothetical protein